MSKNKQMILGVGVIIAIWLAFFIAICFVTDVSVTLKVSDEDIPTSIEYVERIYVTDSITIWKHSTYTVSDTSFDTLPSVKRMFSVTESLRK